MRIVRFELQGRSGYGILEGEKISVLWGTPYDGLANTTGEVMSLPEVTLLAPCEPTKIVALGLNYRDHAAEFGHPLPEEPLIFMKPSTAVIGPDEDISLPGHVPAGGLRGGAGRGDRPDLPPRQGAGFSGLRPGVYLHQRRHRPGFAEKRRAVHPVQEFRHLRPPGALDRNRDPGPGQPHGGGLPQRGAPAALQHPEHGLSRWRPRWRSFPGS